MAKKKLVQYGAGNIGRGFIGEIFARAGYEVVFIDVQEQIVERINRDRSYPVRFVSDEGVREITISGVRAINGHDLEAIVNEISDTDIIAMAVGVPALQHIIKPVSKGLRRRWELGNETPLDLIICENKLNADKYLRELFYQELNDTDQERFNAAVGLVEASIGRMAPIMTSEMQEGNPLRVCVEEYAELPIDGDAMKGEIPKVKGLITASPFSYYIRRKLFVHNLGHAVTAYLGLFNKNEYIAQAIRNPYIRLITEGAMLQSVRALSEEYKYDLGEMLDHVYDLIIRFHNRALGDTVLRVGGDPWRKLAVTDRLAGAALYCGERNLPNAYINVGIAAGLFFEKFTADKKGIGQAIKDICGIESESAIGRQIVLYYNMLSSGKQLGEVLYNADIRSIRK